jgi:hypothetical protein
MAAAFVAVGVVRRRDGVACTASNASSGGEAEADVEAEEIGVAFVASDGTGVNDEGVRRVRGRQTGRALVADEAKRRATTRMPESELTYTGAKAGDGMTAETNTTERQSTNIRLDCVD